jgi:hypothetical protein
MNWHWRSNPDWWMVIFTALAVLFAGVSARFLYQQLGDTHIQLADAQKTARLEQQAWVQLGVVDENFRPVPNAPLVVSFRTTNVGKIPASKVNADFYIEIVESNVPPTFDFQRTHVGNFGGVLFPSAKFETPAAWLLPNTTLADPPKLPEDIWHRLMEGQEYVALYAQATYTDAYGDHWLKWCQ